MSTGAGLGGASFQVRADTAQFTAGMKRAKEEATRATQQINTGLVNMNDRGSVQLIRLGSSAEKATKSLKGLTEVIGGRGLGLGLLQLGQFVDDAQYGFRSIVNNIPQMVYMFGGSAGLAGGVGIAAVAINQLVNHWDQLVDLARSRWLNVAASDLERVRLAAEKAGDAFDKLIGIPSEAGAREVSKIKEAIIELQAGGAAGVFKGVSNAVAMEPGLRASETEAEQAERARLLMQKAKQEAPGFVPDVNDMLPELKDINKRLEEMDAALQAANNKRASQILGGAMQPGEEGFNSRATLRNLVNKYAGSFSEEFVKAMQRTLPEIVKGELDLEHQKANRARSAGVAGQILQSPIGTEMMLGGAPGGPATPARLAAMMSRSRRRFGAVMPEMIEGMTKAGLTEEQAAAVLGKMSPKATYDRGVALSKKLGVPLGQNGIPGTVDGRVLMQAMRELFAEAMKGAANNPGGLEGKIRGALKAAGAQGDPKEIEAEMRAQLGDRMKQLVLERGLTQEQAKRVILQEQQERAFGGGIPSQFVGIANFSRMIQTGALNSSGDIAKRSLDELMAIRKALQNPPPPPPPRAK